MIDEFGKDFIKHISTIDRSKNTYDIFRDFCELAYCAHAKLTADEETAQALEDRYMQVVGTYRNKDDIRAMPKLLGIAAVAINQGKQDFLGSVATELEVLDSKNGQFFTPYEVSKMLAHCSLCSASPIIEEQGYITLSEPAAGAGGMVLAAADVLEEQGHDPALNMLVNAVDVSPLCYHMLFIQLTYRGIPALVERANSLSMERFESAWTHPTNRFYAHNGTLFPEAQEPEAGIPHMYSPAGNIAGQMELF